MLQRNSIITRIAETVVKVHEKMMQDDSGLRILIKKRDETKRAADNIVKAIEQGIITDFTKDRLNGLQAELNELEIEINKAAQKSYAHLSVEEVEKFLLSKVFENPEDIKVRKLLVNTFIREVIWYGDHMVITYNFQESFSTEQFSKSYVDEIEKQVGEASRSASSFSLSSDTVAQSAPKNSTDFRLCYFLCAQKCFRRKTGLMLQWIFCYEKLIPEFDWCSGLTKPGTLRNKIKITHKWDAAVYYIYQGQGGNL